MLVSKKEFVLLIKEVGQMCIFINEAGVSSACVYSRYSSSTVYLSNSRGAERHFKSLKALYRFIDDNFSEDQITINLIAL